MTAASAIAEALHARGVTTQRAQADTIGEHPVMWCRYLKGHRSPQCSKVQAWLDAADASGHTLHLTWDPHVGCVAKVEAIR